MLQGVPGEEEMTWMGMLFLADLQRLTLTLYLALTDPWLGSLETDVAGACTVQLEKKNPVILVCRGCRTNSDNLSFHLTLSSR